MSRAETELPVAGADNSEPITPYCLLPTIGLTYPVLTPEHSCPDLTDTSSFSDLGLAAVQRQLQLHSNMKQQFSSLYILLIASACFLSVHSRYELVHIRDRLKHDKNISSDEVEGSGQEDDREVAISEAVNKVVELVDEVVSNLSDSITDLEVNDDKDNEIIDQPPLTKKKCGKCVRKGYRKNNADYCSRCDQQQHEVTTAMTTPATTTTTTEATTTTSPETTTFPLARLISEKRYKIDMA